MLHDSKLQSGIETVNTTMFCDQPIKQNYIHAEYTSRELMWVIQH